MTNRFDDFNLTIDARILHQQAEEASISLVESLKPFYLPFVTYKVELNAELTKDPNDTSSMKNDIIYLYLAADHTLRYKVNSQDNSLVLGGVVDESKLTPEQLKGIKNTLRQTQPDPEPLASPTLQKSNSVVKDKIAMFSSSSVEEEVENRFSITPEITTSILAQDSVIKHTPFRLPKAQQKNIIATGENSHQYRFKSEYIAGYRKRILACSTILGIPVAHLEEILQTAVANNGIIGMRPTNLASRELVEKENAVGKPMTTKPKSSEGQNLSAQFDPTNGFVPFNQAFSKLGQDAIETRQERIAEFQHKADHVVEDGDAHVEAYMRKIENDKKTLDNEFTVPAPLISETKKQLTRNIGNPVVKTTWFSRQHESGVTDFICTADCEPEFRDDGSRIEYYYYDKKTMELTPCESKFNLNDFEPLMVIGEQTLTPTYNKNTGDVDYTKSFRPYTADCDLFAAEVNIHGFDGNKNENLDTAPMVGVMRNLGNINEYQEAMVRALGVATSDNVRHGAETGNPISFISELNKDLAQGIIMLTPSGRVEDFRATSPEIVKLQTEMVIFKKQINDFNFQVKKYEEEHNLTTDEEKKSHILPEYKPLKLELNTKIYELKRCQAAFDIAYEPARKTAEQKLITFFNENRKEGYNLNPNVRWGWELKGDPLQFQPPLTNESRVNYEKVFKQVYSSEMKGGVAIGEYGKPGYKEAVTAISNDGSLSPEDKDKAIANLPANVMRKIYELSIAIEEYKYKEAVIGKHTGTAEIFAAEHYSNKGVLDVYAPDYHAPVVNSTNCMEATKLLNHLRGIINPDKSPIDIEKARVTVKTRTAQHCLVAQKTVGDKYKKQVEAHNTKAQATTGLKKTTSVGTGLVSLGGAPPPATLKNASTSDKSNKSLEIANAFAFFKENVVPQEGDKIRPSVLTRRPGTRSIGCTTKIR